MTDQPSSNNNRLGLRLKAKLAVIAGVSLLATVGVDRDADQLNGQRPADHHAEHGGLGDGSG